VPYRPYWFCGPALPLAVSSATRSSGTDLPWSLSRSARPLFGFSLPPEYFPTLPSPPAGADKHLSWASIPYSTSGFGGLLNASLPFLATFRLQGLATLLTAYSLRARAGFLSHRQRSWDSPFGAFPSRKVTAAFAVGRTHLPFHSPVFPPPKRWAGPTSRGSWASALPGVPDSRARV
jgi:hypothetical protein